MSNCTCVAASVQDPWTYIFPIRFTCKMSNEKGDILPFVIGFPLSHYRRKGFFRGSNDVSPMEAHGGPVFLRFGDGTRFSTEITPLIAFVDRPGIVHPLHDLDLLKVGELCRKYFFKTPNDSRCFFWTPADLFLYLLKVHQLVSRFQDERSFLLVLHRGR